MAGSAQSDAYPFNPDSDGDGIVGVADLLALLSDFGLEAEVETCFRGEIYECSGQMDAWSAQYLPNDCGIVRAHRNGFRRVRLPVAANEGDVLYAITVQSTYVNASLIYQTLIVTNGKLFYPMVTMIQELIMTNLCTTAHIGYGNLIIS